MSMYVQFLEAALEAGADSAPTTTSAALAELRRCRRVLDTATNTHVGGQDTSAALADQLAYDVALMATARSVAITCDTRDFDRPQLQREELEQALEAKGVQLAYETPESEMSQ
jgi:hypothetical protein